MKNTVSCGLRDIVLGTGAVARVSESTSLAEIKTKVPSFFTTPFGKRETYTMYRGFLIVRNTVQFSSGSERKTIVYLFTHNLEGRPDTFCVSPGTQLSGIQDAKKLIDKILETGRYEYGMSPD
jgi:hypothetical protein